MNPWFAHILRTVRKITLTLCKYVPWTSWTRAKISSSTKDREVIKIFMIREIDGRARVCKHINYVSAPEFGAAQKYFKVSRPRPLVRTLHVWKTSKIFILDAFWFTSVAQKFKNQNLKLKALKIPAHPFLTKKGCARTWASKCFQSKQLIFETFHICGEQTHCLRAWNRAHFHIWTQSARWRISTAVYP